MVLEVNYKGDIKYKYSIQSTALGDIGVEVGVGGVREEIKRRLQK